MADARGTLWKTLAALLRLADRLVRRGEPGHGTWAPENPRRFTAGKCVCCRTTEQIQSDHVIALAKGGHPTSPRNRQPLCAPCNKSKYDSDRCKLHNKYLGPPGGRKVSEPI